MEYQQFSQVSRRKKLAMLRSIALEALTHWTINVSSIRFYGEHSNVLFKIRDDRGVDYILKIARPGDHSFSEIEASLQWLHFMNRHDGSPLMQVVPPKGDQLAVSVQPDFLDEPRYCSLYNWIDGKNLSSHITIKNMIEWGRLSSWIHQHTENYSLRRENDGALMAWDKVFYWDKEVLLSSPETHTWLPGGRRDIYLKTINAVSDTVESLFNSGAPPVLLHGDLHPDNVKVNSDGAFGIDVEDVMWGYDVQDIAVSLLYVRRRKNWPRLYQGFRQGYEQNRSWPVESDQQLWSLFCGRQLMFANYIVKLEDWSTEQKEEALNNYEESFREFLDRDY